MAHSATLRKLSINCVFLREGDSPVAKSAKEPKPPGDPGEQPATERQGRAEAEFGQKPRRQEREEQIGRITEKVQTFVQSMAALAPVATKLQQKQIDQLLIQAENESRR